MTSATEHFLAAEAILRRIEHMFPDDPNVQAGLAKAAVHAQLAMVAFMLDGPPADPDIRGVG